MIVSEAIRDLLATKIDSFEKLDIVVALDAAPHHSLPVDELAETLNCPKATIRQAVSELCRVMLLDRTSHGDALLMPLTESDRRVIAELLALYQADRSIVVRLLGELAMRRIRGMAARAFSDAFVLGRKKGDRDG